MPKKFSIGNQEEETEDPELESEEEEEEDETEEDEDEEEEDDDDDEDVRPSKKKSPPNSDAAMNQVVAALTALSQKIDGNGSKSAEKKVSKAQQLLAHLQKEGYDKGQVAALGAIVETITQDIREEIKEESKGNKLEQLNDQCESEMQRALAPWIKEHPFAKKAIPGLINDMVGLIDSNPEFSQAKNAYLSGRKPAYEHFEKVADKAMRSYLREAGIKVNKGGGSMSKQLDLSPSRSRASKNMPDKSGKIDVKTLNPFEEMIYVTTLNHTRSSKHPEGNFKLAAESLSGVRGIKRLV